MMAKRPRFTLRRAYEPPTSKDGRRVLVERLWPRGLKKEDAKIDLWLKDVAPSTELRKWYGHDPARWSEFRERYLAELSRNPEPVEHLEALADEGPVTLVAATKDVERSGAAVLLEYLESRAKSRE